METPQKFAETPKKEETPQLKRVFKNTETLQTFCGNASKKPETPQLFLKIPKPLNNFSEMPKIRGNTSTIIEFKNIRKRLKNFAEMPRNFCEIFQKYQEIPQKY